jgi:hypothetical protein
MPKCAICGKELPQGRKKYCSIKCFSKSKRKGFNDYSIKGDYAEVYLESKRFGRQVCLVDLDTLQRLIKKGDNWTIRKGRRTFYVNCYTDHHSPYIQLHRFVMNACEGELVDHINGNGLDNRRENLRICTNAQNVQNQVHLRIDNKSGIRGVCWDTDRQRWMVRVGNTHFGRYKDIEEARQVAIKARKELMPFSTV